MNYNYLADIVAKFLKITHTISYIKNTELEAFKKGKETLNIQVATLERALGLLGK